MYYMCRTGVLYMYLLYTYYTYIPTHVIHVWDVHLYCTCSSTHVMHVVYTPVLHVWYMCITGVLHVLHDKDKDKRRNILLMSHPITL